ncbi:Mitochondrial carrier protein [seawater metagenome]|uniref:Mitochondrial carrier protein n=1 Tax=seawater metagenome TaxID=1561972 RepID=A0A5E8CLG4_9ZZZZ
MTIERKRPPFEKIAVGPMLVLGEMLCFGHYMESLKIAKQATGLPYKQIASNFWKLDGPMSFYRGFFPYGFIQMGKGLPVLFTQSEVKYQLDKNNVNLSNTQKGIVSGISAGVAQAIIITPLQRLKTVALTDVQNKGSNTTGLFSKIIKEEGAKSLFKGLPPMIIKRSLDWGIRFGTISYLEKQIKLSKGEDYKLSNVEKIGIGFTGGIMSCFTIPVDTWLANCQKHSDNKKNMSAIEVGKNMFAKNGFNAFTRGMTMRILHSGYHTAWIAGLGSIIFSN